MNGSSEASGLVCSNMGHDIISRMNLPTFIVAGAAKAGSSSLYHYLGLHPEVCMSAGKEPAFFTKNWGKDLSFYAASFAQCSRAKAFGEATVEYMVDPEAPARIAQVLPDVRLVFSLRDPVERAVSHYWHRVKGRSEHRAINVVLRGAMDEYPIRYSLYATHLERFLQYFPRERMHIIILEEMRTKFSASFATLLRFLDVDPEFSISSPQVKNSARIQRSTTIEDAVRSLAIRTRDFGWVPRRLRRMAGRVTQVAMRANMRPFRAPELDADIRERLSRIFQPEATRLEDLLGRKIPAWNLGQTRAGAESQR